MNWLEAIKNYVMNEDADDSEKKDIYKKRNIKQKHIHNR